MIESNSLLHMSPEEFYSVSQDRTRRYLGGSYFESVRIGIAASPEIAQSYSGQVLILTTTNLLSRFCRSSSLAIPNVPLHPFLTRPGTLTLIERVKAEMCGANPFADYEFGDSVTGRTDYTLQLGIAEIKGQQADLVADGDGWNAFVGHGNTSPFQEHIAINPIGPAAAACLAIADIFKALMHTPKHLRVTERMLSLFDFSFAGPSKSQLLSSQVPDLGTTQMIGVGSVGSAVVYLLGLLPVHGCLVLIDHQNVGWENLDRSAIFMATDVHKPKVDVAKEWLAAGDLAVASHRMDFAEFIEKNGRGTPIPDLVLLLANERNVYSVLQNNFPPLVIYGTTTSGWGVNLGRHIPMREECVLCRYPNQTAPSYKCSSAPIITPDAERVDASLPFLSFMAGVIATAELFKGQIDGYPFQGNYVYMDLMGPLETIAVAQRMKQASCSCSQQSSTVYYGCIEKTRWAGLSI